MKRLVLFLSIIVATSAITWALKAQQRTDEKKYPVSLTIPEWEKTISQLQWIGAQIKQSDMPSRNSVYATDSILTPLIQQLFNQLNAQVQAEMKQKQVKDSTVKKQK